MSPRLNQRQRDASVTNCLARKVGSASFSDVLQLHKLCETFPAFRFVSNEIVLWRTFSLPKIGTAEDSFRKTAWLSRIQNRPNFFAAATLSFQ